VNHQLRPWICMNRLYLSLNLTKYQNSQWVSEFVMSIKMVPPSKCYVVQMLCCMLCCLVHVSTRKQQFDDPSFTLTFHPHISLFHIKHRPFCFHFLYHFIFNFKLHLMLALLFVSVVFLRWLFRLFILGFSISSLQILVCVMPHQHR